LFFKVLKRAGRQLESTIFPKDRTYSSKITFANWTTLLLESPSTVSTSLKFLNFSKPSRLCG